MGAALALLSVILTAGGHSVARAQPRAALAAADNAIVIENRKTGTTGILGTLLSRWSPATIAGYADATSLNRGSQLTLRVSTSQPGAYTISVYRLGYYRGVGSRLVASSGVLNGVTQRACEVTELATHLIECSWGRSATFRVGDDWTSGLYIAVLNHIATGRQSPIYFVVRDDLRQSDIVFQSSRTTGLAYNSYGNGTEQRSLYPHNSTGGVRAMKVSFDRPMLDRDVLSFELEMLGWLESQGYDVTYITNMDVHTNASRLLNHKVFLSVGHDEYWSKEMRDGIEAARNSGVSLGFFSANSAYWRVRFEPSSRGRPNRVMVCYKYPSLTPDPVAPTYRWRDPPNNRPENALLGVMYIGRHEMGFWTGFDWVARNVTDPAFANTGLTNGAALRQLVGYEWDGVVNNGFSPRGLVILGASPVTPSTVATGIPKTATQISHTTRYTHASGAQVFATGSIQWMWALNGRLVQSPRVDARAQQFAVNVLAGMGARPATPSAGIVVP
jgi:hypothetical protein